jgi:hypothetical protein
MHASRRQPITAPTTDPTLSPDEAIGAAAAPLEFGLMAHAGLVIGLRLSVE